MEQLTNLSDLPLLADGPADKATWTIETQKPVAIERIDETKPSLVSGFYAWPVIGWTQLQTCLML